MIFAAIGVVVQLKDALNTVWEVGETPGHGTWHFIRNYVVSLAAVLALGFLLMVSLIVTAGLAAFGKYAAPHLPERLFHLVTIVVSVCVISLLFAMMFKCLPDAAIDWYDVWLGAVLTAVLFEKSAIGFYIGKQGLETTYGAAASIIVVATSIWLRHRRSAAASKRQATRCGSTAACPTAGTTTYLGARAKDDVARNQKRTAAAKIWRAVVAIGEHEAARCWPTAVAANSTEDTISGRTPHCTAAATTC